MVTDTVNCPHCGAKVDAERVVCPNCNRTLPAADVQVQAEGDEGPGAEKGAASDRSRQEAGEAPGDVAESPEAGEQRPAGGKQPPEGDVPPRIAPPQQPPRSQRPPGTEGDFQRPPGRHGQPPGERADFQGADETSRRRPRQQPPQGTGPSQGPYEQIPPPRYQQPAQPPQPPSDNGMAIGGLIMSIIGTLGAACCCVGLLAPIGLVLSAISHNRRPTSVTWAGIIVGIFGTLAFLGVLALNIYWRTHPELFQQLMQQMMDSMPQQPNIPFPPR